MEELGEMNTLDNADVIYTEMSSKRTSRIRSSNKVCEFDHQHWKSRMGLKKGSKLEFKCSESFDYPTQKDCK